jgi:glycosyltransferase involved in cell wall biosynthesis
VTSSRIVFAEQFYYPEAWGGAQLLRDLTTHLSAGGCAVEVVCGSDPYVPEVAGDEAEDPRARGVVIRKTPRLFGGDIHRLKLLKHLVFYACCLPLLLLRRRPAVFVTQTNPPLLVPLVTIVALLHRRPSVIIAQDVYPELLFAHGMLRANGIAGRLLRRLFGWSYRRAAKVVALGEVMRQRLIEKGAPPERVEVISNWATGAVAVDPAKADELRAEWGLEGHFVILYSGNIGISHDVETPIAALKVLLDRSPNVRLVFMGKGTRLAAAKHAAARAGVAHAVQFRPLVPSSRLPQALAVAQVALVTLREGFEGLVVPSKLFGYMSRALATIYVGPPSDAELVLRASGGGICQRNGAAAATAEAIRFLIDNPEQLRSMGAAAARYYESHLSRAIGLAKHARLIAEVAALAG